jgi:Putative beta-barrel porin-2, OmpL-like. bbp2
MTMKQFTQTLFFLVFMAFAASRATAQESFKLTGYLDSYFGFYTDSTGSDFSNYPTISPRDRQFGLNVAMLSGAYSAVNVRGNFSFFWGDIPTSAWEPGSLNMIQNANVGVRLAEGLWLDAGLFNTHVGTELLLPKDNLFSSLAVNTWHEPYFHAGAELSYTASDKVFLKLVVANRYSGFADNNRKKAVGILAQFKPSEGHVISYSNIISDDTPDGTPDDATQTRFFNNLYYSYSGDKLTFQVGADLGLQANSGLVEDSDTDVDGSATMYSALIAVKYKLTPEFSMGLRGEIFNDEAGFLSGRFEEVNDQNVGQGTFRGLQTFGLTLGTEYKPTDKSYLRLEGRYLSTPSELKPYYEDGEFKNNRLDVMVTLGVYFESLNLLQAK